MPREVRIGSETIGGSRIPVIASSAVSAGPVYPGGTARVVSSDLADQSAVSAVVSDGRPVLLRRSTGARVDDWLAAADQLLAGGIDDLVLGEGGDDGRAGVSAPDLAVIGPVRARSDLPVAVDLAGAPHLVAAAVAAGADGLILAADASPADVAEAIELATTLPSLVGRARQPQSLMAARQAIDQVDAGLANLLERRAQLAGAVQRLKPVGGFAGRDPQRERDLVTAMARRAPRLGLARVRRIMEVVIEAGLELSESEEPHVAQSDVRPHAEVRR